MLWNDMSLRFKIPLDSYVSNPRRVLNSEWVEKKE
jgi:hypothetical protein